MPPSLRKRSENFLFTLSLRGLARLSRGPFHRVVEPLLGRLAQTVRGYRGARAVPLQGAELGREWQRMMPNPRVMPVTHVDGPTAYGEIHVPCPLRGSGDVEACHRLMAYDRALLRPAGARFVVLESQAEPGVTRCRVAMRPAVLPADDLIPAHVRASRA
jgi:hypothetical protein